MADLNLYGPIGMDGDEGVTASRWAEMTSTVASDEPLTVYLNSPGGSVFDGLTIYQSLVNRTGENHIVIQGVAASIASIIAMAGDTITMGQASRLMVHNPMGPSAIAFGTSEDLRDAAEDTLKTAALLDSIRDTLIDVYASRTGQTRAALREFMASETWLTASEAKKHGFADSITPNKKLAASSYGQPVAVAMQDVDELRLVADLAAAVTIRQPGMAGRAKAKNALRLAQRKMQLTFTE